MKYFVDDWNAVWKNIPVERGLASEADVYLLWQDITPEYKDFIKRVHEIGKKVVVLQHGRRATVDYLPPKASEPIADKYLLWGTSDMERMREASLTAFDQLRKQPKYVQVGCPLFDALTPRKEHEGINVVFCPIHLSREYNENLLIAQELRKLPKEYKVTSKLLPVHLESSYDNPVVSNHRDPKILEQVAEVLSTADVVVGVEDGTFEMLAMSLDIPVINCDIMGAFEYGDRVYDGDLVKQISKGNKIVKLDQLNDAIVHTVAHPEEFRAERRETCVLDGGLGLNAVENIMREIQTI